VVGLAGRSRIPCQAIRVGKSPPAVEACARISTVKKIERSRAGGVPVHEKLPYDAVIEARIAQFVDTKPEDFGTMLDGWWRNGARDEDVILTLALVSARYVDHRGPLVGHGTLNAAPVLRAGRRMAPELRRLAVLQLAFYVHDVIHHPNYGPYLLWRLSADAPSDLAAATADLAAKVESGRACHWAEHLFAGAVARFGGPALRWTMTRLGLRQFAENEHRLLIVRRADDLMGDCQAWSYAEALWRPAVQYLASAPDTRLAEEVVVNHGDVPTHGRAGPVGLGSLAAAEALVDVDWGQEPAVLAEALRKGITDRDLQAAILLAASQLLLQADTDPHVVTGVHAVVDIMETPEAPDDVARLARLVAFSGLRTRRAKARRADWEAVPRPVSTDREPDASAVRDAIRTDPSGGEAAALARGWTERLGDPAPVFQALTEVAVTAAGPFASIHLVKMLEGLRQAAAWTPEPWRHAAAGARAVARELDPEDAQRHEPAMAQAIHVWRASGGTDR
jgi:hypothetical protein